MALWLEGHEFGKHQGTFCGSVQWLNLVADAALAAVPQGAGAFGVGDSASAGDEVGHGCSGSRATSLASIKERFAVVFNG